ILRAADKITLVEVKHRAKKVVAELQCRSVHHYFSESRVAIHAVHHLYTALSTRAGLADLRSEAVDAGEALGHQLFGKFIGQDRKAIFFNLSAQGFSLRVGQADFNFCGGSGHGLLRWLRDILPPYSTSFEGRFIPGRSRKCRRSDST